MFATAQWNSLNRNGWIPKIPPDPATNPDLKVTRLGYSTRSGEITTAQVTRNVKPRFFSMFAPKVGHTDPDPTGHEIGIWSTFDIPHPLGDCWNTLTLAVWIPAADPDAISCGFAAAVVGVLGSVYLCSQPKITRFLIHVAQCDADPVRQPRFGG